MAREYLQRAEELDRKLGIPGGVEGPMTKEMKPHASRVLAPVVGALTGMPSDVDALADLLIAQISAIPRDDAEAQRRAKLDIASRLNQLRNAAYAAGFAARK